MAYTLAAPTRRAAILFVGRVMKMICSCCQGHEKVDDNLQSSVRFDAIASRDRCSVPADGDISSEKSGAATADLGRWKYSLAQNNEFHLARI